MLVARGLPRLGRAPVDLPAERARPDIRSVREIPDWLAEAKLYDSNLVAQEWLALAAPRYDFVGDRRGAGPHDGATSAGAEDPEGADRFLLCGDSNQIVHPNFFSWSRVKSLFWRDPQLAERQELRVLTANFRNGRQATRVANTLLKIKHRRFGSIDRESNFLVEAVGGETGHGDAAGGQGHGQARAGSTRRASRPSSPCWSCAKRTRRRRASTSRTPLLFSIHEAKGLEYENIVLFRFVSDHRASSRRSPRASAQEDSRPTTLDYRRARDKSDKSLEVYKFFVNALYVALTRADQESVSHRVRHRASFVRSARPAAAGDEVAAWRRRRSSLEEWQKEARKLELQGKQEQAEAIRRTILKQAPLPWPVFDEAAVRELLVKVFRERAAGGKPSGSSTNTPPFMMSRSSPRAWRRRPDSASRNSEATGLRAAAQTRSDRKYLTPLRRAQFQGHSAASATARHRPSHGHEPDAADGGRGGRQRAAGGGLLERGADREAADHMAAMRCTWPCAKRSATTDSHAVRCAALYELLAPTARGRESRRAAGAHRQASVRILSVPDVLDAVQVALHAYRPLRSTAP